MRMYDIIHKKRDGIELEEKEIEYLINEYTRDNIPDYQMSAFLMAVFLNGMSEKETSIFTEKIANSGDIVDLSELGDKTVDKHSTGGVGDKTTLIVAPIVASLGGKVAKMSGRGLGHTGGTIDKLESIEGFNIELSPKNFLNQVEKIGISVIGQSGNLAPADKKIYALRDVTATVDCIPLIASSIMSKKIAAGSKSIVLDVKTGSGAFMKKPEDAEKLAATMVKIGRLCNRKVAALITNMDIPLGFAIGNNLEVIEAIEVLKGKGCEDLRKICISLSSVMLSLCKGWTIEKSEEEAIKSIEDGKAFNKFREWINEQGGNIDFIDNPNLFPRTKYEYNVSSPEDGFIMSINTEQIGILSSKLGAGREKKEDIIDYSAGIKLVKKTGDKVSKGETIAVLYTSKEDSSESLIKHFTSALKFSKIKPENQTLIYKIIK